MTGQKGNLVYLSCAAIALCVSSASGLFLMPDFVSSCETMIAQNSTNTTFLKLAHGLGEVPLLVDVQVKVTSGDNADFIFQAQGCRPRDYFQNESYGGVIYRYNDEFIEISTPIHDHSYSLGSIVYTGLSPYWEGNHTTDTYTAMVLVRAWKASSLPPPDFSEKNINISSGSSSSNNYIETTHGLQTTPTLVISRTKLWSGSQMDYYSDSIGSTMVLYDQSKINQPNHYNGFVLYGFNDTVIRAWASSIQEDSLFEGGQGWHFSGRSLSGELELFAWTASSLGPDVTTTVDLGIGVSDLSKSFSQVDSVDNTFSRAWVEASGGPNDGYRFVGSGSLAYETSVTADGCSYGGLVYAYSENEVRFWQPGAGDSVSNGALVCIPNAMGNGQNVQATSEGQAVFHVWKLDIDECAVNADDCDVNAICSNTQGSFDCTCNSGYSGDGKSCTDVDECTAETHNCSDKAVCTNTEGSFTCSCDTAKGFFGQEESCFEIVCYPNNTINLHYLPANYHYFAMQNVTGGNDVKCTVNDIDSTSVSITDCSKDLPILLTYGTYSGMETNLIHGGKSMLTVVITCQEIPDHGNTHSINRTFSASLTIDEEKDINPSYQVTSVLSVSSATVGSPVGWTINCPVEYALEVTNCFAYPGTNDESSLSVALLTNGGCTSNSELVSHFTDNKNGSVFATIQAFKFFESDDVFLKCSLKICPAVTQDNCNTQCSRQRRSTHEWFASRDHRVEDTHLATVHNVLRIVDPSASASNGNTKAANLGLLMCLMATVMACFC